NLNLTTGASFPVVASETTDCTITNHLLLGSIIVIKHVANGGPLTAGDFTMFLGDSGSTSFTGAESPGVKTTLPEGSTYSVTEGGRDQAYTQYHPLYTGSSPGDCSGSIVAGTTKTCTITNTFTPASPNSYTEQRVILHDKVTILGIFAGGSGTQTAPFKLYFDSSCSPLLPNSTTPYSETINVSVSSGTGTASTSVGFLVNGPVNQTYYWRVS